MLSFFLIFTFFDILRFRNSSDQRTPIIGCFRRNQSIGLLRNPSVNLKNGVAYKEKGVPKAV